MKNNPISELISRYFNERHLGKTEIKVQKWLLEENHPELKEDNLFNIWEDIDDKANIQTYNSLDKVKQKLGIKKSRKSFWHNPIFQVAAVLIPFALSIFFSQNKSNKMVEIITLSGEQKEITLPDGSTAWMNACSKISYPEEFKGDIREVCLIGEAFFSVRKDTAKMFSVTTKEMTINVLGTEFNVIAYAEDKITSTTLIRGKVEVKLKLENKNYTLKPNQELTYNRKEKSFILQEVPDNSLQWRDGILIFNDITFIEILERLERQYGVDFQYDPSDYSEDNYSVKFTNQDSIEYIMKVMQDVVGGFLYDIKNNKIILTPRR